MAILGLFIGLCSCSDDDSPFEGTDSYISFFQLEKNGKQYNALITGDNITIEIDANVDLSNANAEYKISELSEITPDPKTVNNWEEAIDFTVKSYNNEEKTYHFSLVKNEVSSNGDVSLLTQDDVDAFSSLGATKIDGNLIIDDVENLDILNQITEVSKNIVIKDSFGLEQFNALKNLKKAGNIYFGNPNKAFNPKQEMEIHFESLESVGEIYVNTAKVKNVDFPKLENAYAITINSSSIESVALSSLNNVYGNLSIQSERNDVIEGSNNVLKELHLNKLTSVIGNITFSQLSTNELIDLSKLTSIGGKLQISNLAALNSLKLDVLNNVDNAINLEGLDALLGLNLPKLTLAGSIIYNGGWNGAVLEELNLPNLTMVSNDITLTGIVALLKVEFPKLTETGSFELSGSWGKAFVEEIKCPELTSVKNELSVSFVAVKEFTFPKLTSCKSINLDNVTQIKSLDLSQVTNLEKVELVSAFALEKFTLPKSINELVLNGGNMSTVFPTLEGIESISEKLEVTNYNLPKITIASVKDLKAYSQTYAPGQTDLEFTDLEIISELELALDELHTLKAPKLKKMDKLNLKNPCALETIEWPLLKEITSELKIEVDFWYNCPMANLNVFTSVTKLGSVDIANCAMLNDFSGLKNAVASLTEEKWKIEGCAYNPTFQNMKDGEFIGQ
ncbi:hypothetical protein DF185_18840 [Marinifilum breve]|uniref:Receptor L-domain domain-containing protein n=2 Tax=Marinifilum breve TaxID=2184082 RepID=A0A2V4A6R0_9BACT|nr:hypothetical protein DF185_18840 [Marinifilum breve]